MCNELELKVSLQPYNYLNDKIITKLDLNTKYVSDGLDEYFKTWLPQCPVLISAPTGMGKNHFIENSLLEFALETNTQILIISNRIATNSQQKERIEKLVGCEKQLELLSSKGLDNNEFFKNVRVITYQKLDRYFDNIFESQKLKNYYTVVFDECHFFLSDALFNNKTYKIFKNCLSIFRNSIRLYMTATPDDIFPVIVEREKLFCCTKLSILQNMNSRYEAFLPKKKILFYNFERNYEYVLPKYFKNKEDILKIIEKDETNSKWLIFVSNLKDGEEFERRIGTNSIFVSANSKHSKKDDGKIYNQIVKEEKYNCKVLVSTSVLDNGINIKDPLLKNIVILSYDKTEFLQMLGRKRITNDENVNLYICSRQSSNFNAKLLKVNNQIAAVYSFKHRRKEFLDKYYTGTTADYQLVNGLFYFDNECIPRLNVLAEGKLYNDKLFYEKMIKKLSSGDENAFINEQLSWLGLDNKYNPSSLISNSISDDYKNNFINFIEAHCSTPFSDETIKQFGTQFKILANIAFVTKCTKRDDRPIWGVTIMRRFFEEHNLNYDIQIKNKTWLIKKKVI